jgi:hypothetical protein
MQNSVTTIDRFAVASRLRALIFAGTPDASSGAIAESLGVRESMVRASIDESSPHPWLEVVAAVVRRFGVDPTWILTGEYDHATHREALEDEPAIERLLARTTLARESKSRSTVLGIVPTIEGRRHQF